MGWNGYGGSGGDVIIRLDGQKAGAAEERPLAETDFALYEALNLLKARSILREGEPSSAATSPAR